jgi:membrane protein
MAVREGLSSPKPTLAYQMGGHRAIDGRLSLCAHATDARKPRAGPKIVWQVVVLWLLRLAFAFDGSVTGPPLLLGRGRDRMKLDKAEVIHLAKRLYQEARDNDLSGAAAELAYRFFLALFPFFIFIGAMGGLVADLLGVANPTDEIMNELGKSLPPDAASVLRSQLEAVLNSRNVGLMSVGFLLTVWASSSGVGTIIKTTNRAYNVRETRPIWKRWALSITLTVLGGLMLIGAFILFIVGQIYGMEIARELGVGGAAASLLAFARWPVVVILSLTATAVLYWAAPNVHLPFKWITPGALLFTVGWLLASYLFGLYVGRFGGYNTTYGTLGGVVILLIWFYITSLILLLGAQLNAVIAQEAVPEKLPQTPAEGATSETIPSRHAADVRRSTQPARHRDGIRERALPVIFGAAAALLAGRWLGRPGGKSTAAKGST